MVPVLLVNHEVPEGIVQVFILKYLLNFFIDFFIGN